MDGWMNRGVDFWLPLVQYVSLGRELLQDDKVYFMYTKYEP